MTCSRHGVLHENINTLVKRQDWETFKESVVLSMIPGGTSNGFCTSVLRSIDENYGVLEQTYRLLAGKRSYMDLVELDGEFESSKVYMFLMFSWGLLADIA